jgi:hypothetical protein
MVIFAVPRIWSRIRRCAFDPHRLARISALKRIPKPIRPAESISIRIIRGMYRARCARRQRSRAFAERPDSAAEARARCSFVMIANPAAGSRAPQALRPEGGSRAELRAIRDRPPRGGPHGSMNLPWRSQRAQSSTPRRDVVTSSAGQMRDERRAGPACSACLTCPLTWRESPCLHLDQGGDENPDDSFRLVVPTGFEPVSPP